MILHRYVVSRVIWAYMLSIGVTYSITLCLFPGLESEIRNTILGEWLPILIMATFNMSDFVGKVRRASHVRSESSVWCVSVFFPPVQRTCFTSGCLLCRDKIRFHSVRKNHKAAGV